MKIVIIYPTKNETGLKVEAGRLAATLSLCGHEVIAFNVPPYHVRELSSNGVTAHSAEEDFSDKKLARNVLDLYPDVVHIFGLSYARAYLPMFRTHIESIALTVDSERDENITKYDLRGLNTIFVDTDATRDFYARRVPSSIKVIAAPYILPEFAVAVEKSDYQIASDWGLVFEAPTILLADNYDHPNTTKVITNLIESLPFLVKKIPGLQVVIVGNGKSLASIDGSIIETNKYFSRKVVSSLGFVEDITPLLKIATVCVGNGRFVTDALRYNKATIAAGAENLVGVITTGNYLSAAKSAFGKHAIDGGKKLRDKALAVEIAGLFDHPSYRYNFAKAGSEIANDLNKGILAILSGYFSTTSDSVDEEFVEEAEGDILIIAPDNLRDVLDSLAVFNAIREKYIRKRINIIANEQQESLLKRTNIFDYIYIYPRNVKEFFSLSLKLFRRGFLYLISMRKGIQPSMLSLFSFAKKKYGISSGGGSLFCYTDYIDDLEAPNDAKLRGLSLAGFIGVNKLVPTRRITLPESIINFQQENRIIMFSVSSTDQIDIDDWKEALRLVKGSHLADVVIVTDEDLLSFGDETQVINVNKFDDLSLAALLTKATLIVARASSRVAVASTISGVACLEVSEENLPSKTIKRALKL